MAKVTGGEQAEKFIRDARKKWAQRVTMVQIGFFETAKYPDGTPVAGVAAAHEFGAGVPQRPFMSQAIKAMEGDVAKITAGRIDIRTMTVDRRVAGLLGEAAVGHIVRSIVDFSTPPNSPATIRRKGSSSPLIDTGLLRRSATYKVIGA